MDEQENNSKENGSMEFDDLEKGLDEFIAKEEGSLEEDASKDESVPEEQEAEGQEEDKTAEDEPAKESVKPAEKVFKQEDFDKLRSIKDRELADIQKKIKQYENMLKPVADLIEYDSNGFPIRIKPEEKPKEQPKPVTKEMLEDEPEEALKAMTEQIKREIKEEQKREDQRRLEESKKQEFVIRQQKSQELNKKEYPESLDQTSDFYKRGLEIASRHPELQFVPEADYIINKMVAFELAQEKAKIKTKEKTNKNKMLIMQTGNSNAQKESNTPKDLNEIIGDDLAFRDALSQAFDELT